MANVKKALYNVAVFLVSLFITGSINVSNIKSTQDTSRVTLTVNETETLKEMLVYRTYIFNRYAELNEYAQTLHELRLH